MKPSIKIRPLGNMGNQMLQYMFALNLQRLLDGNLDILGVNLPVWNIRDMRVEKPRRRLRLGGHLIDIHHVAGMIRAGTVSHVLLDGLGFQLSNYGDPCLYRNVFTSDLEDIHPFGADQVVINIRAAEILGNTHPDYGPLPFSYIDSVLDNSNASPVFLGQIEDNEYCNRLKRRYARAEFRPSRGAMVDFETLRRSREISVAVSTFSWLAAWLSSAEIIHYPVSGILSPSQRPDINLLPRDDRRYRFYGLPVRRWSATSADFANLWAEGRTPLLDSDDIDRLTAHAQPEFDRQLRIKKTKIAARAYFMSAAEMCNVRTLPQRMGLKAGA